MEKLSSMRKHLNWSLTSDLAMWRGQHGKTEGVCQQCIPHHTKYRPNLQHPNYLSTYFFPYTRPSPLYSSNKTNCVTWLPSQHLHRLAVITCWKTEIKQRIVWLLITEKERSSSDSLGPCKWVIQVQDYVRLMKARIVRQILRLWMQLLSSSTYEYSLHSDMKTP